MVGGLHARVVSSDRFLIKILDQTVSFQDIAYQLRNLKALNCAYEDAFIIRYFGQGFIKGVDAFVKSFPSTDEDVRRYMHAHVEDLKTIRHLFKMLRYAADQKSEATPKLTQLVRDLVIENKCGGDVLYKQTLRTNFISLIELELYLRSRYGGQLKQNQKFDVVRPSIDLFVESLDKQFGHEYYW